MLGLAALLLSAFWSTSPVQAQTTSAVCLSSFSYLSNKEGQNPCLVAAYLQMPCSSEGTKVNVPALQDQSYYTGPSPTQANYCTCSSVVYSLSSACAACQGEEWLSWTFWRQNCVQNLITVGQYPLDIPAGTAVPAWAFQNVALTDRWNISLTATSMTLGPESTYYGTPTASINYQLNMTGNAGTPTAVVNTQTSTPSPGVGSANASAITGGIIGGIGLLALIGALAWLLIRWRRKRGSGDSPSGIFAPPGVPMGETDRHSLPAAVDYGAAYPHVPSPYSGSTSTMPPKLYDPADPSTFPRTPASFGYQSTSLSLTDVTPPNPASSIRIPTPDPAMLTGGRYSGAPEL